MAELIRLKLAELHVGDRLRPVDMEVAAAIGASFEERGQIAPITVRRTPAKNKGATPYTLVTGGHRCAAAGIIGWAEIDALVVQADSEEAALMEIAENLYRNELNALDRAIFVLTYREMWEKQHGKIERGRYSGEKGHDAPFNKDDPNLPKDHDDPSGIFAPGRELSKRVQAQLGFGHDTYKRATRIGQNLHPTLRAALRGTGAEGDQTKLLKLARLSADDQLRVAASLREKPDLKLALSWLKPEKPAKLNADVQADVLRKILALLDQADYGTLCIVREQIDEKLDDTMGKAA